ncbi:hypothetical protein MMC18_002033 [Xylographa bjoerkii]|nr:hypothetical protein [Xylographa bjoerkii]
MSSTTSTPTALSSSEDSGIFKDFDSKLVFERCEAAVLSNDTKNFVLEFENRSAQCALNVDLEGIKKVCSSERTGKLSTRWINIWAPETQRESLVAIATHYGFSPRLLGLMKCKPLTPQIVPITTHHNRRDFWHTPKPRPDLEKTFQEKSIDIERDHEIVESPSTQSEAIDLSHYTIVNEVWHYASVDWGNKYLCIGYNSLYNTTASLKIDPEATQKNQNRPAGKRVWMWLVLCDDGTVISIHENAYPNHDALDHDEQRNLGIIRYNLRNVFCQISNANESNLQNPLETLPIRSPSLKTDGQPHASAADVPSLLFYYLFDDWYTSYSLVARKEHQYGTQLELLRARMFTTADLQHVDDLHHYGRQLAVLKRIYQSYSNLIERVLEGSKKIEHSKSTMLDNASQTQRGSESMKINETTMSTSIGVPISTTARVRFERLKDRIGLYCLNEIQDCIDEKDALVLLNFNLIAIKESSAVESLTRITILLAKVTILFLPVSLMTAYFSVQIADLTVFGKLSGTQEAKPIYQSLSRVFFNKSKAFFRSRSTPESKTKVLA